MIASNTNKNGNWWESLAGKKITEDKYFHEGEDFNAFALRVGMIFSNADLQSNIIQAIEDASFFPAGRSLYGAGSKNIFKASMSNCYILPSPSDDLISINTVQMESEITYSRGGGCGLNISNLRPRGAIVNNSARTATGAVSFMPKFDISARTIGAHGRRAALMIGLDCTHPDLEEFLMVKQNNTEIQAANTSILFTDEFMECVREDKEYTLKFTVKTTGEVVTKVIKAREFFYNFAKSNRAFAEPGAIFINSVRLNNLLSGYPESEYYIEIPNPCAEYYGNAYNNCTLGSVNLYNVVENPFTSKAKINVKKLIETVEMGITALDEILDYGYDMQPLDANRKCIDEWRAVGLGVFGLADALIAMGLRYGSPEAVKVSSDIMRIMKETAVNRSCDLAKEKGSFGKYNWKYIKKSPLMASLPHHLYNKVKEFGLRNGSLLSIAPAGSIATQAGLSGGAEPLFAISYDRTTHALQAEGRFFKVFAKSVEDLLLAHGLRTNEITEQEIKSRFPFVVASHDILPADRIKMQAALQVHVDNAISSTVNVKESTTVEEIFDIYMDAWESGCKGITIFRDNCERFAIMKKEHVPSVPAPTANNTPPKLNSVDPIRRRNLPKKLKGETDNKATACCPKLYVTVNEHLGEIVEVFVNTDSGCLSNISTITNLTSLLYKSGTKMERILKALRKSKCEACKTLIKQGQKEISPSCGNAIADSIEDYYNNLKNIESAPLQSPSEPGCASWETSCKDLAEAEIIHELSQIACSMDTLPSEIYSDCPECGEHKLRAVARCWTCDNCFASGCE